MLTILGHKRERFCDGVLRRSFLKAGFLGLGGLSLADVLRLRAEEKANGRPTRKTSVIFIELAGGPSQFETYDPKPNAPVEFRGPFKAIDTKVPGVQFCELLPAQAQILDKLAVIRSVHHSKNSHDPSSHLTQTGYYKSGPKGGPNQMPCFGSIIAKARGPNAHDLPAYVALPNIMRNGAASHLGKSYNPFETFGDPNKSTFDVKNLTLTKGLDGVRLNDRRGLLSALDRQRELCDNEGSAAALDDFKQQAFDLVTGSRARSAFNIQAESAPCRDRYGRNTVGQSLLLARRLVESGVTCVTTRVTGWDDHSKMADRIVSRAADFDRGVAALITDLHERGMQDDVLVVAMGEFGRTPRFNQNAGRDHWGSVMSVLISGGKLKSGVFGASNSKGEIPAAMPCRPENVLAMLYRHLGIDSAMTFNDFGGRPRYVLEERRLIAELI